MLIVESYHSLHRQNGRKKCLRLTYLAAGLKLTVVVVLTTEQQEIPEAPRAK